MWGANTVEWGNKLVGGDGVTIGPPLCPGDLLRVDSIGAVITITVEPFVDITGIGWSAPGDLTALGVATGGSDAPELFKGVWG